MAAVVVVAVSTGVEEGVAEGLRHNSSSSRGEVLVVVVLVWRGEGLGGAVGGLGGGEVVGEEGVAAAGTGPTAVDLNACVTRPHAAGVSRHLCGSRSDLLVSVLGERVFQSS